MVTKLVKYNPKGGYAMRKAFLVVALTLATAAPLFAAQRGVAAELFTATW